MDKDFIAGAMLAQQKAHQYKLDQYTDDELVKIYTAMNKVENEIIAGWGKAGLKTEFSQARAIAMLNEAQAMMAGVKDKVSTGLASTLGKISAESAKVHSDILSFGGKAAHVADVAIQEPLMTSFWKTTPVGGHLLKNWVNKTFDGPTIDKIQQEIAAGMFRGETHAQLVKRFKEGFGMSKVQIDTLVRTYVATANIDALKRTFEANKGLIKRVRWSAAYDTRTCLICATLEGQHFPLDKHPHCPAHPRCRCTLVPDTSIGKLGLSEKAAKEWLDSGKVDPAKLPGSIFQLGKLKKDMKGWIDGLPEKDQIKFFGPNRYQMLKDGLIKFEDLVDLSDIQNPRIRTLKELRGEAELAIKVKMGNAEAQAAMATKEAKIVFKEGIEETKVVLLGEREIAKAAKKKAAEEAAKKAAEREAAKKKKAEIAKLKQEYFDFTLRGKTASIDAHKAWADHATHEEWKALSDAAKKAAAKKAIWDDFKDPNATTTFTHNMDMPDGFKPISKPDYNKAEIWEPEMDVKPGLGKSTGAIVFDEDTGKVFIYEPKGHFGGYEHTFPKGQLDPHLSPQQNAIKEIWEEIGLDVDLLDYLGDYQKTTSVSRYYVGKFNGGDPSKFLPDETLNVKAVPLHELGKYLNNSTDKKIAQEFADAYDEALLKGGNDPVAGFSIMNAEKAQAAKEAAEAAQKAAKKAAHAKAIAEGMAKKKNLKEAAIADLENVYAGANPTVDEVIEHLKAKGLTAKQAEKAAKVFVNANAGKLKTARDDQ